jgi:hypothetical protein
MPKPRFDIAADWDVQTLADDELPRGLLRVGDGRGRHIDGGPAIAERMRIIAERHPGTWALLYRGASLHAVRTCASQLQRLRIHDQPIDGIPPGTVVAARYAATPDGDGRHALYVRVTPP